jgi:hypothetical protein
MPFAAPSRVRNCRRPPPFPEAHLKLVGHEVLTLADQAFGRLRRNLAHDYDLPKPDWAV